MIVEIISPTDRWRDVRATREEYFAIGVEQMWVVEPEQKSILVFSSPTDLVKLTVGDTLQGTGVLTGFTLALAELFGDL